MATKKYSQAELDIQRLNNTLDNINSWLEEHKREAEIRDNKINSLEVSSSKQSVINTILGFVSGALVVAIVSVFFTKFV
jgi:hypothetical protein